MSYYIDRKSWTIRPEPPGASIPTALVPPVAALLGLGLVVGLPFVGFALVGQAMWRAARHGAEAAGRAVFGRREA